MTLAIAALVMALMSVSAAYEVSVRSRAMSKDLVDDARTFSVVIAPVILEAYQAHYHDPGDFPALKRTLLEFLSRNRAFRRVQVVEPVFGIVLFDSNEFETGYYGYSRSVRTFKSGEAFGRLTVGEVSVSWEEGRDGGASQIQVVVPLFAGRPGAKVTVANRALVFTYSSEHIIGTITQMKHRYSFQALLFVLAGLVIAVMESRAIAQPLTELERAVGEVRVGNLQVSIKQGRKDEVGRLAGAFDEMVKGLRQRDEIKGLFKRYLNPTVVDELIRNPASASPGGERRDLTVMFVDLVGFTALSERLEPEELVGLLNRYFDEATNVIARHGGTVDKFMGDAIMSFWNAPLIQADHQERACLAALDVLAVVDRLRPEFEERFGWSINCRIGINSGHGVVGNIGSARVQDYTVMGDAVNLASRLESAAGLYNVRTLVSGETIRGAVKAVLARELDLVRVKGKVQPTRVYELIARAGEPNPPSHLKDFETGLRFYREQRFLEALAVFSANPRDPPSLVFAGRCRAYAKAPPGVEWTGTHEFLRK